MEFLVRNPINTSTMISVDSNTATSSFLLERNLSLQYYTDGYDTDTTLTTITFNFDVTETISRIVLMEHNFKDFTIYYDGVTANTFDITTTGSTTTSDWDQNSETSMFIRTTPVNCTSVSIDIHKSMVANSEKVIGYALFTDKHFVFDRIPSADSYVPEIVPKSVVHKLSDGGTRIQKLDEKWRVNIGLSHIGSTLLSSLETVFKDTDEFVFSAFGTMTSWDEILFPCVWSGSFDFHRYSDNASEAGNSGSITLWET